MFSLALEDSWKNCDGQTFVGANQESLSTWLHFVKICSWSQYQFQNLSAGKLKLAETKLFFFRKNPLIASLKSKKDRE